MKKFLINTVLFVLFTAGLLGILSRANFVLRHKEYAGVQDKFAELPEDSVDIVFVGSSHQFCSISPEILYDEYGIESFMLATSAQTVPMSYYAAMEAIELQNPEMIVFEVSYCANDFRTVSDEMSHCFFDGMPECKAKYLAIEDLIEEEKQPDYYVLLGTYHSRWKEITKSDFSMTQFTDRGGVYYENVMNNPPLMVIPKEDSEPIPEEMEKYLDKMVSVISKSYVAGNANLADNLREINAECWLDKKHNSRRMSEAVQNKLFIPTMLMFVGILVVIMIPAMAGFNF